MQASRQHLAKVLVLPVLAQISPPSPPKQKCMGGNSRIGHAGSTGHKYLMIPCLQSCRPSHCCFWNVQSFASLATKAKMHGWQQPRWACRQYRATVLVDPVLAFHVLIDFFPVQQGGLRKISNSGGTVRDRCSWHRVPPDKGAHVLCSDEVMKGAKEDRFGL